MKYKKVTVSVLAAAVIAGTVALGTSTALADLYGDINRDGEVNAGDAGRILWHFQRDAG